MYTGEHCEGNEELAATILSPPWDYCFVPFAQPFDLVSVEGSAELEWQGALVPHSPALEYPAKGI
jgi:hypothetical protein